MAESPEKKKEEPPKDNAFIQEFMTAYLYGVYAVKGGRLSPDEAIRQMLGFASMAEKASGLMKIWKTK